MRISPIDIQQKQFKSRPFGYEKAGVDQFLEILADELERLIRKNQDLQEELSRAHATLNEMRSREETLKETLVTTQRVTDELKTAARREVDVMMAEAEIKAERLMYNAEERRQQLIDEIQEIKRQKIDFEVSLRGLLERHIRMLELNTVAIEQKSADARLLDEPLPSARRPEYPTKEPSAPADDDESPLAEAESSGPEKPLKESPDTQPSDLVFDFDPTAENDEEDLHK
jgi:cell division initiation protein